MHDPETSVLFLTHEFPPFRGGVATYVRETAEAAARTDQRVWVLAPDYAGRAASDEAVQRFRGGGRLNFRGVAEVAWAVWHRRAQLAGVPIVAMSAGALMALILLDRARLFRPGRLLCFFHGSEILKLTRQPLWKQLAPGFFQRWGHAAVASEYVRDLLNHSNLRFQEWNEHLAPCACPTNFLKHLDEQSPPFPRYPSDSEGGRWRVLTVARLHPRKGQLEIARALSGLPVSLRSRVVYQMAGVGLPAYQAEVASACREGDVAAEFLGDVPDAELPALYRQSDVCAQASRSLPDSVEGFGITYLEAAAASKPVVAFASGGTAEAVIDGRTGLLVPEGNLDALRDAFAKVLLDPDQRHQLGEAGWKHARSFRWEEAALTLVRAARLAYPAAG